MSTIAMSAAFTVVKATLFLVLAILVLYAPIAGSVEDVYSYSHLASGSQLYTAVAASFLLHGLLPSLLLQTALAGLFPAWRVLRVALPLVAALSLAGWAAWMWVFFGPAGKFPDTPRSAMRWSLVVAGPLGIVVAAAFMFLLARARRPAAPSEMS